MAAPTLDLILALRATAARLRKGARFQWTHMGACICGNLVQTITDVDPAQLHRIALQRAGDWGEQAYDFCPTSGLPMDHVLGRLVEIGLRPEDIRHLERLSDPRILDTLGGRRMVLDHRNRDDVVRYLDAWAVLLEAERPAVEISAA